MEHCDLITICFTGTYLEKCETISGTGEDRTFAIAPENMCDATSQRFPSPNFSVAKSRKLLSLGVICRSDA